MLLYYVIIRHTANSQAVEFVSIPTDGGMERFLPSSCKFFSFTSGCHDRACERHGVAPKALTERSERQGYKFY